MNVVTFSEADAATTDATGAGDLAAGSNERTTGRQTATYAEMSRALQSF
ncbi:hypothetical protein ACFO0N_05240 [Halobium salinum]|uniref:Uncharacterized protein n=1 Tax=Halobium salinum TaxID=1364940 RepID=A0ABD5P8Y7_9EURY|nr:hypothetical protein [Halobium salinum]